MAGEGTYYVPEQSKLPIFASVGLFLTVYGASGWINGGSSTLFIVGLIALSAVLWAWFSIVIKENLMGLNDAQLKRSYVWAMGWFIFSEVMFFAAFFGALFYMRNISLPELGGDNTTNQILWYGFEYIWPLMVTPDMAVNGAGASVIGPEINMSVTTAESIWTWLPFWNTTALLASSFTVHFAHTALKNDKKSGLWGFNFWLGVTVVLGIIFLFLQAEEYIHVFENNLTIDSGAYGTTFFMLTGFHGLHVTMGTFMLLVMLLRSIFKGHFSHKECFGFVAASWYWHFVDVVWVGLFIFVYILG